MSRKNQKNKSKKQVKPEFKTPTIIKMESPSNLEKSDHAEKSGYADQASKFKEPKRDKWTRMEIMNLALTIGTFLLFIVAYIQYKASIQISEKNINIIKDQFDIDNEPYLTISNLDSIYFDTGRNVEVFFEVSNVGKSPVRIDSISPFIKTTLDNPKNSSDYFNSIKGKHFNLSVNQYVINSIPYHGHYQDTQKVSIDDHYRIFNTRSYFFFGGEMFYTNLINNEKRRFEFLYGITVINGKHLEMNPIRNENFDD